MINPLVLSCIPASFFRKLTNETLKNLGRIRKANEVLHEGAFKLRENTG